MRSPRRITVAAAATLTAAILMSGAASADEQIMVQLPQRQFIAVPGVDQSLRDAIKALSVAHGVIELSSDDQTCSLKLASQGIYLARPIDSKQNIWLATFATVGKGVPSSDCIRWAGLQKPEDIISPQLREGKIPSWARGAGSSIIVRVVFYPDVSPDNAAKQLQAVALDFSQRRDDPATWTVTVAADKINALASDSVMRIDFGPGPARPLSSTVTGVVGASYN